MNSAVRLIIIMFSDTAFTVITDQDTDNWLVDTRHQPSFTVLTKTSPRSRNFGFWGPENLHIREARQSFAVLGRTEENSEEDTSETTFEVVDDETSIGEPEHGTWNKKTALLPARSPLAKRNEANRGVNPRSSIFPSRPYLWSSSSHQPSLWNSSRPSQWQRFRNVNDWMSSNSSVRNKIYRLPSLPKKSFPKLSLSKNFGLSKHSKKFQRFQEILSDDLCFDSERFDHPYDLEEPRVPFNTPETLSSSSSAESSPDMPIRKEKVIAALKENNFFYNIEDEDDHDHLDFSREDHLASYIRTKLNRVTARTLYLALMEMRTHDYARDSVMNPVMIDNILSRLAIPLKPCLPHLHAKFRDKRFVRSTNYEKLMIYLEERRFERQKLGPEEIKDWTEWSWNKEKGFRFQNTSSMKSRYVKN